MSVLAWKTVISIFLVRTLTFYDHYLLLELMMGYDDVDDISISILFVIV